MAPRAPAESNRECAAGLSDLRCRLASTHKALRTGCCRRAEGPSDPRAHGRASCGALDRRRTMRAGIDSKHRSHRGHRGGVPGRDSDACADRRSSCRTWRAPSGPRAGSCAACYRLGQNCRIAPSGCLVPPPIRGILADQECHRLKQVQPGIKKAFEIAESVHEGGGGVVGRVDAGLSHGRISAFRMHGRWRLGVLLMFMAWCQPAR